MNNHKPHMGLLVRPGCESVDNTTTVEVHANMNAVRAVVGGRVHGVALDLEHVALFNPAAEQTEDNTNAVVSLLVRRHNPQALPGATITSGGVVLYGPAVIVGPDGVVAAEFLTVLRQACACASLATAWMNDKPYGAVEWATRWAELNQDHEALSMLSTDAGRAAFVQRVAQGMQNDPPFA